MRITADSGTAPQAEPGFASTIDENKKNHWSELKGKGFKAHWEYYWQYYWLHTVVCAVVLVVSITLIHDIASRKPVAIDAVFINAALYRGLLPEEESFASDFAEYAGIDMSEEDVTIDLSILLNENVELLTEIDIANSQRIFAQVAAGEIDILGANESLFHGYAVNDMFSDLRDILSAGELARLEDAGLLYTIDTAEIEAASVWDTEHPTESFVWDGSGSTGDLVPIGVRLSATALEPASIPVMGVPVNTSHPETAADLINYLTARM